MKNFEIKRNKKDGSYDFYAYGEWRDGFKTREQAEKKLAQYKKWYKIGKKRRKSSIGRKSRPSGGCVGFFV